MLYLLAFTKTETPSGMHWSCEIWPSVTGPVCVLIRIETYPLLRIVRIIYHELTHILLVLRSHQQDLCMLYIP